MTHWKESSFSCSFQIENEDYCRFTHSDVCRYRNASAIMLVDSLSRCIPWSSLKSSLEDIPCFAPEPVILLVLVVDEVRVCLL